VPTDERQRKKRMAKPIPRRSLKEDDAGGEALQREHKRIDRKESGPET